MNEKDPHEIEIRQQAFKLFEKGKSVAQILKCIPGHARGSSNGRSALNVMVGRRLIVCRRL
jgi:hypothetical protein